MYIRKHSRSRSPQSFWPAVGIESFGRTNRRTNLIPRVFVPLDQQSKKRETPGATISGMHIDADRAVKPDGQNSVISFVISKWLLPESLVF